MKLPNLDEKAHEFNPKAILYLKDG